MTAAKTWPRGRRDGLTGAQGLQGAWSMRTSVRHTFIQNLSEGKESGDGREGKARAGRCAAGRTSPLAGGGRHRCVGTGEPCLGEDTPRGPDAPVFPQRHRCRSGVRWKLHGKQMWQRYVR